MAVELTFAAADYAVFGVCLAISLIIGVVFAFTGGKQRSTAEYLYADRDAAVLPVTMSIVASFISSVAIIGIPAEIYLFGTMYAYIIASQFIVIPIVAHVFLPVFHRAQLGSVYEYVEHRFESKFLRVLCSLVCVLITLCYIGVVLYAPSLTLSQVTGIKLWMSLVVVGVVCTLYTTIGGMKTVLWTDFFQMLIIFGGSIAAVVQAVIVLGGPEKVWDSAKGSGRLIWNNFDPDPRERLTFWGMLIGYTILSLGIYASNQTMTQRYVSVKSKTKAKLSLYLTIPVKCFVLAIFCVSGVLMYIYFENCDPYTSKRVSKSDQMMPLMVVELFRDYPGMAGLFMSAIFAGALSSVSSGINSLSCLILEDFIRPCCGSQLSDSAASVACRVLAAVFGLVAIGLSFAARYLGTTVIQIAQSVVGMLGGPLLGVFVLGVMCPIANVWGATLGLISGLGLSLWVGVASKLQPAARPDFLFLSVDRCSNGTTTTLGSTITTLATNVGENVTASVSQLVSTAASTVASSLTGAVADERMPGGGAESAVDDAIKSFIQETGLAEDDPLLQWYRVSYLWYATIGFLTVMIVGLVCSCVTGCNKRRDVDARLLCLAYDRCCCCLHPRYQDCLNCGATPDLDMSHHLAYSNGYQMSKYAEDNPAMYHVKERHNALGNGGGVPHAHYQ